MDPRFQQVVKTSQQSLHNKRRQSRVRKETHTQELDDVRMTEGAHQLTFSYKLCGNIIIRNLCSVLKKAKKKVADRFSGADGSRYGHLLDTAVGSRTYSNASESHVREYVQPQPRIVTEKISGHNEKCILNCNNVLPSL